MLININARFLTQSLTGVQRYAVELLRATDALIDSGDIDSSQYSFSLLAPKDVKYELDLRHIPVRRVGLLTGHLWEQFELPFYARGGLLVSLCNTAPFLKAKQVITIHDAAVFASPRAYSRSFRAFYKVLLPTLGKIAKRVITVSQFSREELEKYCHITDSKLRTIYVGVEHIRSVTADVSIMQRHGIGNRPFILAVSSMNLNKNFHGIIKAAELLENTDFDVVIAGGANPKVFAKPLFQLPGTVKYLGYISDNELKALYTKAACLVYPSFYEGFGSPPLEAMACGCPVIVSEAASLPEVCGDAAIYCDPNSPEDIAAKIKQMMSDDVLRKSLRQKGLERSMRFSWKKCGKEVFEVIKEALNG